jgi:predicted molibdopterin-dependent oxidoreductase YjgC
VSTNAIQITVNGRPVAAQSGISVASALLNADEQCFRISERGQPRAPLCGMGVCYECRVMIDDVANQRACMIQVRAGMRVTTGSLADA